MRSRSFALAACAAIATGSIAWAHPHVAFDASVEFQMRGRTCVACYVDMIFDPLFSASLILEYDANRDRSFDIAETAKLKKGAFDNLRHYGYFVFLRKGDRRFQPESIEGFSARIKDGLLIYRFKIPLVGKGFVDDFSVAVFDSTYYCQVVYPTSPAKVTAAPGSEVEPGYRIEVAENRKYPIYYNPYGDPSDYRVYTAWANGLETAYPAEIRMYFKD